MKDDTNDELVESIAPDVTKCLDRADFFSKLDDLLCPAGDSSKNVQCSGDYNISERLLLVAGFEQEDLDDIFRVLQSKGGCCDCEILYNVADSSRLKSQYWRNRAVGLNVPMKPHKSHD